MKNRTVEGKRISVFGLGYVGCVCAGCFSRQGHSVIGVDALADKIGQVSAGKPTVIEPGLAELIGEGFAKGRISATSDCARAVEDSDIGFICVGTPSGHTGHLDLANVLAVAEGIGRALRAKDSFFTIVIRSTVMPGTNRRIAALVESVSGKANGVDFGVVSNPEFLREGSAIQDFMNPEISVIGSDCARSALAVEELYSALDGEVRIVSVDAAELIKYVSNSFHALKVAFANEVGGICKAAGIDSHEVMRLFCEDKRLNISSAYLMPGQAYGGSCLPKDLKGLATLAHDDYLETPVIGAIERSNSVYKESIYQAIVETGRSRIGFVGLSFKADTDDLRSSPSVELIERLIGKGLWVLIHDRNVNLAKLVGANKAEIERRIPKIQSYVTDLLDEVVDKTDVIVISRKEPALAGLIALHPEKIFIDLARIDPAMRSGGNYRGIAW